jgi:hypothetical protein
MRALQAAEKIAVLKGHGFSRAANATKRTRALAPEECFSSPPKNQLFPQEPQNLASCSLSEAASKRKKEAKTAKFERFPHFLSSLSRTYRNFLFSSKRTLSEPFSRPLILETHRAAFFILMSAYRAAQFHSALFPAFLPVQ